MYSLVSKKLETVEDVPGVAATFAMSFSWGVQRHTDSRKISSGNLGMEQQGK